MVHVAWVYGALVVGGCFGALVMALMVVGGKVDKEFESDWIQELENEK